MKTMDLLAKALAIEPAPYWTKKLKLSRGAIHTAKTRGNLSPAIAGALAEELGEDAAAWMVIAALEGERESACKTRMIKKFIAGSALALSTTAALAAPTVSISVQSVHYVKSIFSVAWPALPPKPAWCQCACPASCR